MSAADKKKLDGIATGANNYSLPTASSSTKGGIKVGTGLSMSSETLSVAYGTSGTTACAGNDSRLSDSRTPKAHASSSTTYGVGSTSNYGHLKVGDNITVSSGTISLTKSNVTTALGFEPVGTGAAVGNTAKPIYWAENTGPALCTGLSAELSIPEFDNICLGDIAQSVLSSTSISKSTGTSAIILSHGGKYMLSACGSNFIFTMPSQYSLPLAASDTRGGIKIGYTASGANIPLKLSSEQGYVTLTGAAIKSAIDNGGDLN